MVRDTGPSLANVVLSLDAGEFVDWLLLFLCELRLILLRKTSQRHKGEEEDEEEEEETVCLKITGELRRSPAGPGPLQEPLQ
ncbi:hypothetical protein FQN60_013001 [Etheostoma spectabile]|uniref:Uncharacterized protein n=1 Tax=Etheostoma spectabile TaxID=54343 RepID=A0A5J5DAJ3_9PERO|nr:hypothetical protein FQN60_013001 [Etheostoma spectabile]